MYNNFGLYWNGTSPKSSTEKKTPVIITVQVSRGQIPSNPTEFLEVLKSAKSASKTYCGLYAG
jgi:hypothetical protein